MSRQPATPLDATLAALALEAERAARRKPPYDGLFGLPPKWLPVAMRQEFLQARDSLLDAHSEKQVRTWIADFPKRLRPFSGVKRVPYLPPECARAVDVLTRVRRVVRLGAKEGTRALLGDDAYGVLGRHAVKASDRVKQSAGGRMSAAVRREKAGSRDERIRGALAKGRSVKQIAADLGTSETTVRRVLNRRA